MVMASSFDEVQSHEDETYHSVLALYAAIKDTPGILRVRRAEMRQGEVRAEFIDFTIDVELKAKRVIMAQYDPYDPMRILNEWYKVLDNPEQYPYMPVDIRKELGREFELSGLGVDGAYRMLYWQAKNNRQDTREEIDNGIFE